MDTVLSASITLPQQAPVEVVAGIEVAKPGSEPESWSTRDGTMEIGKD